MAGATTGARPWRSVVLVASLVFSAVVAANVELDPGCFDLEGPGCAADQPASSHDSAMLSMLQTRSTVKMASSRSAGAQEQGAHVATPKLPTMLTPALVDELVARAKGEAQPPLPTFAGGIPMFIHFTWSNWSSLESRGLVEEWIELNPTFETLFWDDECVEYFMTQHSEGALSSKNETLEMLKNIPKVSYFDFFRYLLLFKIGGVYSDIDVDALVGVLDWTSRTDVRLISGWEARLPLDFNLFQSTYVRHQQVEQWTIAGAPGHPVFATTMNAIEFSYNKGGVVFNPLELTGPAPWTDALNKYCEGFGPFVGYGEGEENDFFKKDVLILRKERFSYMGQSGSWPIVGNESAKFIHHNFLNSWLDAFEDAWAETHPNSTAERHAQKMQEDAESAKE